MSHISWVHVVSYWRKECGRVSFQPADNNALLPSCACFSLLCMWKNSLETSFTWWLSSLCSLTGWAHVVCALYIPEVEFANVSTMEPIVLQSVPHERYNKVTECTPPLKASTVTAELSCVFSSSALLTVFSLFVRPDMLHLRGPRPGEQSSHWSLHDLQQTWLQTGLPRHMVRCAHMTPASRRQRHSLFLYVCRLSRGRRGELGFKRKIRFKSVPPRQTWNFFKAT